MGLRRCLNWKVLSALAVIGVGVIIFAPGLAAAALPILLLAACPLSMLVIALGMGRMGRDRDRSSSTTAEQVYTCPMHPEMRRAAAGRCPTCGMALVLASATVSDEARLPALRSTLAALQAEEEAVTREIAALDAERVAHAGVGAGEARR